MDPIEIALEVRDCIAWNDARWENALDCGVLAWVLGTSAAKIIGSATALTGVGAAVAAGAIAADEVQDVARAVTVTTDAIRRAPTSLAKPTGVILGEQLGPAGVRLADQVVGSLPTSKGDDFLAGVHQGALQNAGLSSGVAEQVATNVDDVSAATGVVKQLDGLDEVPASMRSDLVVQLTKRGGADDLASAYDAGTLREIVGAAGGSGGSSGDDLLDEAADLARSGRADDVARLADELDPDTFRYVLEADSVSSAVRHLEEGLTGSRLAALTDQLKKLNGQNGGDTFLFDKPASGNRFKLADVDFSVRAPGEREVFLIDTDKWKAGTTFDKGVHDFRHVAVRHVDEGAPGQWPVDPGTAAGSETSKFPAHMGPDEVKDVIRQAVEHADESDVTREGFNTRIEYTGSALPEDVDRMRVVFKEESGQIVTAFPPS